MPAKSLPPLLPGDLIVERTLIEADRLIIEARARARVAACPWCQRRDLAAVHAALEETSEGAITRTRPPSAARPRRPALAALNPDRSPCGLGVLRGRDRASRHSRLRWALVSEARRRRPVVGGPSSAARRPSISTSTALTRRSSEASFGERPELDGAAFRLPARTARPIGLEARIRLR